MLTRKKKRNQKPARAPKPVRPRRQTMGAAPLWGLCLAGSGLGFALRRLMLGGWEPAFGLLSGLSAVMLVAMVPLAWAMGNRKTTQENFPASGVAALGCALAGGMLLVPFVGTLLTRQDVFDTLTAALGVAGAVCLMLQGWMRKQGGLSGGAGMVTALALAMDLISRFRHWSSDPLLGDYCFKMLASICVMLAAYHMAGFPMKMGDRGRTVYFTMTGLFFSVLSLADGGVMEGMYYGGLALWMLLGGCTLRKPEPSPDDSREPEPENLPEVREEGQ